MATSSRPAAQPPPCGECEAPMEAGQRYCLECGARRGSLSPRVAGTVGALLQRARRQSAEHAEPAVAPEPDEPPRPQLNWRSPLGPRLPTPRVAMLAVICMLGFGVILGSLGNVSVQALASAPSVLLNLPGGGSSGSAQGGSGGGSGGGGGGGSGGQQVQTVTVGGGTAPGSSSAAGSSGSSSGTGSTGSGSGSTGFNGLPPIKHVFLIVLSQQGYNQTFSPTGTDSYLNKTLAAQGELVQNYYAVAGSPLANEIALLSGQGPTQQTEANCPTYETLRATGKGSHQEVLGDGCVYPSTTKTLGDQLTKDHKTWRAYIEGMTSSCGHPRLGAQDAGPSSPKHPYAAWTNPFVFFQSVVGSKDCRQDDVGLGQLKTDLKSAAKTPSFAYIAPSPCDDGSDQPCAPGAPSGLSQADHFLRSVVPEIKRSPAYAAGGLILITFDGAPLTGTNADASSCCNAPTYPNLPGPITATPTTTTGATTTSTTSTLPPTTPTTTTATTTTPTTPTSTSTPTTTTGTTPSALGTGQISPTGGGGQVGLLLISKWVKTKWIDPLDYLNHFALLEGVENLFGLGHLGYAGVAGLPTWTSSIFNGKG